MGTTQLQTAPEPKYWHLKSVLSEALETEFTVGQILPNERDLAARFGVARATLRQALEQLELEGRLQRRRGVGTTVAPPRVGVDLEPRRNSWPGAPDDVWHTESCEDAEPPTAVRRLLALDDDRSVHVLRRTRKSHGQAVATELVYVPAATVPGVTVSDGAPGPETDGEELARSVLRELHRLTLESQDRAVELGSARAEDARRLDRLPGAPVLVVTTRYTAGNRTAAVAVATYRADTCRLTFSDAPEMSLPAA